MTHLGTLRGTGRISIEGNDIGPAVYYIDVYRPRSLIEAGGHIEADRAVLSQLYPAKVAQLRLETGGEVDFFIKRWDFLSTSMTITITGNVPGFR